MGVAVSSVVVVELDVSCSGLVPEKKDDEEEKEDVADDAPTLVFSLNTDLLFIDQLLPLISLEL